MRKHGDLNEETSTPPADPVRPTAIDVEALSPRVQRIQLEEAAIRNGRSLNREILVRRLEASVCPQPVDVETLLRQIRNADTRRSARSTCAPRTCVGCKTKDDGSEFATGRPSPPLRPRGPKLAAARPPVQIARCRRSRTNAADQPLRRSRVYVGIVGHRRVLRMGLSRTRLGSPRPWYMVLGEHPWSGSARGAGIDVRAPTKAELRF